jgi:hypothetical protein
MEKGKLMPVGKKEVARARRVAVKSPKLVSMSDPKFRSRFEKAKRVWQSKLLSLAEGARLSEQLSERDLAIRINARG